MGSPMYPMTSQPIGAPPAVLPASWQVMQQTQIVPQYIQHPSAIPVHIPPSGVPQQLPGPPAVNFVPEAQKCSKLRQQDLYQVIKVENDSDVSSVKGSPTQSVPSDIVSISPQSDKDDIDTVHIKASLMNVYANQNLQGKYEPEQNEEERCSKQSVKMDSLVSETTCTTTNNLIEEVEHKKMQFETAPLVTPVQANLPSMPKLKRIPGKSQSTSPHYMKKARSEEMNEEPSNGLIQVNKEANGESGSLETELSGTDPSQCGDEGKGYSETPSENPLHVESLNMEDTSDKIALQTAPVGQEKTDVDRFHEEASQIDSLHVLDLESSTSRSTDLLQEKSSSVSNLSLMDGESFCVGPMYEEKAHMDTFQSLSKKVDTPRMVPLHVEKMNPDEFSDLMRQSLADVTPGFGRQLGNMFVTGPTPATSIIEGKSIV